MTDFDNTNRGVLFRNDKKETENHPDYTGSIDIGGVDHWLSAWVKTSAKGNKFMSLSVKAKDAAHKQGMAQTRQDAQKVNDATQKGNFADFNDFDDSSIPF